MLRGGVELSQWSQRPGEGAFPSVETVFTPDDAARARRQDVTYLHSQGTVGFDWRTSPGYSRRGGFYGVTLHDYTDRDEAFGFQQVDYEAIQHFPILREAWVLSLHGLAQTDVHQERSADPVLHAAVARRRLDAARLQQLALPRSQQPAAAGRVAHHGQPLLRHRASSTTPARSPRARPISICNGLKSDYGFGFRFHGPLATPLRVEVAQEPRRPRDRLRVVGRVSESGRMSTSSFASRTRSATLADRCWSSRSARLPASVSTQRSALLPDDPIAREPESQDASQREALRDRARCTR